jgi:hypothetical protein
MRPRRLRLSPALVVAIAALVVALGGVAYATIPDSKGVIHGCYDSGGNLKVIDTSTVQSCPAKGYKSLDWNRTGPQGPAGSKGDTGPTGPAGAPGVSAAYSTGDGAAVTVPRAPSLATVQTLTVPAGKYAVTSTVDSGNNWNNPTLETCILSDNNGNLSSTRAASPSGGTETYRTMGDVITLQGTTTSSTTDTISVQCNWGDAVDPYDVTNTDVADIDAIAVNTINGS